MKNILTIQTLSRTAVSVLLAATISAAYAQGNGNNQPSGQAGATGTSNVVVTNTSAQPVPTKDQNNGAYQPFTFTGGVTTNGASGTATVTVPAGKRLVIEHISGEVEITSSGSLPSYSVHTVSNGNDSYAWANMTWVGEGGSGTAYLGAQPVKLYADAASTVTLTVLKSRDINHLYSGWVGGYISISGYLVNIP